MKKSRNTYLVVMIAISSFLSYRRWSTTRYDLATQMLFSQPKSSFSRPAAAPGGNSTESIAANKHAASNIKHNIDIIRNEGESDGEIGINSSTGTWLRQKNNNSSKTNIPVSVTTTSDIDITNTIAGASNDTYLSSRSSIAKTKSDTKTAVVWDGEKKKDITKQLTKHAVPDAGDDDIATASDNGARNSSISGQWRYYYSHNSTNGTLHSSNTTDIKLGYNDSTSTFDQYNYLKEKKIQKFQHENGSHSGTSTTSDHIITASNMSTVEKADINSTNGDVRKNNAVSIVLGRKDNSAYPMVHQYNTSSLPTILPPDNGTIIFQNSQKWLEGPNFSNIHEDRMTAEFVRGLIFDVSPLASTNRNELLLKLTMCPAHSNFVSWRPALHEHKRYITSLSIRLIYLAIHEHQHKPARAEAIARGILSAKSDKSSSTLMKEASQRNYGIGPFDFECDPETKYIIASIPSRRGFGINYRGFGVEPILLGLMMDRVALHMNSLPFGPGPLQGKFFYSKCPRRDMQCMFMPLSPCVLTHDDVANATILPAADIAQFRQTGYLDEKYKKEKVLVVDTNNLSMPPKGLANVIAEKISLLYNRKNIFQEVLHDTHESSNISGQHPLDLDNQTLQEVKEFLFDQKNEWKLWHAAGMYGMRPNAFLQSELDRIIGNTIPEDLKPSSTIGIPIRDGDKCKRESQCMSFEKYMQLAQEIAVKRTQQRRRPYQKEENITLLNDLMYDTILLTCDSKDMAQERLNYTKNDRFPFRIIANEEDIGQGHGKPAFYSDADAVMISSMVALKMQLLPDTLIYNSCSNFHKLITLFYEGCGSAEVGHYENLLENDNPLFRMKCSW